MGVTAAGLSVPAPGVTRTHTSSPCIGRRLRVLILVFKAFGAISHAVVARNSCQNTGGGVQGQRVAIAHAPRWMGPLDLSAAPAGGGQTGELPRRTTIVIIDFLTCNY